MSPFCFLRGHSIRMVLHVEFQGRFFYLELSSCLLSHYFKLPSLHSRMFKRYQFPSCAQFIKRHFGLFGLYSWKSWTKRLFTWSICEMSNCILVFYGMLQVNKPYLPLASGEYSVGTGIMIVTSFLIMVSKAMFGRKN